MLKVGITGGIGSGKSLVCRMFSIFGVPIYDADSRAKYLMVNNDALIAQVKANFGASSYLEDGVLNRQYLAEKVFHDEAQLQKLNALVHPKVGEDYHNWQKEHQSLPYTIKEAALMIESGTYRNLDRLVTVSASVEERLRRVLARDPQRDREQVLAIMSKQLSEEERSAVADHILINDESRLLTEQVVYLHKVFSGGKQ